MCLSSAPLADAGDGLDERWVTESAAESADGDLDGLGERVGVPVPGVGEQIFGAEDGGGLPSARGRRRSLT
jgi:hypothetical protein